MVQRLLVWLLAAALTGCKPFADTAKPAFWQVTGSNGERGWLLGTIHSLPRPVDWQSPAIDLALAQASSVAVEVANLGDRRAIATEHARLSSSPGLPPLAQRIDPALRGNLKRLLAKAKLGEAQFVQTETWAVALALARAGNTNDHSANGIDRAVMALAKGKPVVELEGAGAQFRVFDALPESEQRELLNAVLREVESAGDTEKLATAWRKGDFAVIEAETHRGMLADPELREALFTARNRDWTSKIAARLRERERLFVAVGAAHMAGADGLAAMLRAQGFKVTRIQ